MSLPTLLMISAASFVLIHLWEKRWRDHGATGVAQAGFRSALGYLRTVALVATVVYALLLGVVAVTGLVAPLTVGDFAVAIQELHELRAEVAAWSTHWSRAVLILLVVGVTVFSYRRGADEWTRRARDYWDLNLRRARADRALNVSQNLPPTPEMQRLLEVQRELRQQLQEPTSRSSGQSVSVADLRAALAEIDAKLDHLDLVRRGTAFSRPQHRRRRFRRPSIEQAAPSDLYVFSQ